MKRIFITFFLIVILSSCSQQKEQNIVIKESKTDNKVVATWITYNEIHDLITLVDNEKEFGKLVNEKLKILNEYGINTIFLHARAFDDCFYKSKIFPVSIYCMNNKGQLKFDILQTFIDECNKYNMQVHAWINPYRIRNDSNVNKINNHTLAQRFIETKQTEGLIVTDDAIYYNPAILDVQKYILNGIREIIENYDLDGIHIDDYFYPTQSLEIDKELYKKYIDSGGRLSVSDFRRKHINSLVSSIYSLVKSYDSNLIFSISPSADIKQNYNLNFADVELWLNENCYADYIIPQLYYGYENASIPFDKCLKEWLKYDKNSKLIIGLGIYKSGKIDEYAQGGKEEWKENNNIISRQIKEVVECSCYGFAYFSASYFYNETDNSFLLSERENIKNILEIL